MAFSKLTHGRMLDWIRACIDKGIPAPTDAEIQEHFAFAGPERARILLAEMADRGAITIERGEGGERVGVTIGRKPAASINAVGRVAPTIKVPHQVPPKSRRQIMLDILARRNGPTPTTAAPADVARAPAQLAAEEPVAEPVLAPAPPPQPVPAAAPEPAPPPAASPAKAAVRRQITFHVDAATYDLLAAEAEQAGLALGRIARDRFFKTLVPPAKKPLVSAAVAAAAVEHGQPLHEFVAALIQIGFAEHKRQNLAATS